MAFYVTNYFNHFFLLLFIFNGLHILPLVFLMIGHFYKNLVKELTSDVKKHNEFVMIDEMDENNYVTSIYFV